MSTPLPPFTCAYSPAFAELIAKLDCSLLLSTYQAGKVIALSSDGERISQLPRTFDTPMGVALEGNKIAIATKNEVVILANSPELAMAYPKKQGYYDSLYLPRTVHFTGELAMHDLAWVGGDLVGVNTSFSCLCRIDSDFSFRPFWKPRFITDLQHEDRCHLNGMAVEGNAVRWATAFGETNAPHGWRENKARAGVLIDVPSGETLMRNLPMPHSPRIINGQTYLLLSATGEVARVDDSHSGYEVINRINGFVRGMDVAGDFLFVGSSKLRRAHTFGDMALAQRTDLFCGVTAIHLPTGSIVGQLRYENSCDEIYDVKVLPGRRRPNILRVDQDIHRYAVATPEATFWAPIPDDSSNSSSDLKK
jgi:uncharacterized protein (TIGR03032 family)